MYSPLVPDHPRSRGDHSGPLPARRRQAHAGPPARAGTTSPGVQQQSTRCGPPPLARGPQVPARVSDHPGRTSPARAGTTAGSFPSAASASDHPRSRGDHYGSPCLTARSSGPRPLERGPRVPDDADHDGPVEKPRSRGDHSLPLPRGDSFHGPPPLARGPLEAPADRSGDERTTPARAGPLSRSPRTPSRCWTTRSRGDHTA